MASEGYHKRIARWRAFYFTLFVGTLIPFLGFVWVIDNSPFANHFLASAFFILDKPYMAASWASYVVLYVMAYAHLWLKHRCPFCKKTWAFVQRLPAKDVKIPVREYNCLSCGHREL